MFLTSEERPRLEWIHIDKAAELIGVTKHVIKGWFENHLKRGVHYQVIGHQTLINIARLNEWLNDYGRQESAQADQGLESRSSTKESASILKRSLATPTLKVTSPRRNGAGMS